jgi:hypothetical protein
MTKNVSFKTSLIVSTFQHHLKLGLAAHKNYGGIEEEFLLKRYFRCLLKAEQLGWSYTGTIGVIIKAKLNGIIPSIKPLLNKIKQTNFRLSVDIELQALKEANE